MRKLLLNDYHKIKKYLDDANYEGYNSNFVTMMMWDHEYEIYYEIKDNFMVMLHTYLDEKFYLPSIALINCLAVLPENPP